MSETSRLIKELKTKLAAVNKKQQELSNQTNYAPPAYIAHGTHMKPEDYKKIADERGISISSPSGLVLPAFVKDTQNELEAIKDFMSANPGLKNFEGKELLELLDIPERVFAMATKTDDRGRTIFDEKGRPIPHDGTFAYSLKKCSVSIDIMQDGLPLLLGYEETYKAFEEQKLTGHIYIAAGGPFKADYGADGRISELTANEHIPVLHHLEVTPREAMQHNAQIVIFKSMEDIMNWPYSKHSPASSPQSSESDKLASLAEEISAGRATYINASSRGENPLINVLKTAQNVKDLKEKIHNRKSSTSEKENINPLDEARGIKRKRTRRNKRKSGQSNIDLLRLRRNKQKE